MPYKKTTVEVKVPHRSGCDMSHRNSGTETCGTLQPLLVEEVIPNTRCNLKVNIVTQLPPLVSDTYMNVQKRVEAFFVPMRLCCRSFEDFFCDFPHRVATFTSANDGATSRTFSDVKAALPVFNFQAGLQTSYFGPGTLLDYLGFKISNIAVNVAISPLSLVAYHLIWQEYYRNPKVQNPAFCDDLGLMSTQQSMDRYRICSLPYKYFHRGFTGAAGSGGSTTYTDNTYININQAGVNAGEYDLADGVSIFSLRQRNFGQDFFTTCRPTAQQGNAAAVSMITPAQGAEVGFTIAQLRASNSLQMFRERNNIASPRMVDQVRARYNANLSDGVAQRPICIGSAVYDVFTRGVDQTAFDGSGSTPNPFDTVAAQYGRGYSAGSDFIIEDFTANEPGFIMVLQSLVPVVTYASGIAPYLRRYLSDGSVVEMATPILQNVGDEPVMSSQIVARATVATDLTTVFGYQDRYGSFMFHPNEVHGKMRDGQDLAAFVLQRSFPTVPTLGSQFLEIPTNYLDSVFAASSSVTGVSSWYDAKLDWKLSLPLMEFSIPSLQDPAYEHGDSVFLRRNGQIF